MAPITFNRTGTKQCPFCGEVIQARAIKCRYCAEFINTEEARSLEEDSALDQDSPEEEEEVLFSARPSLFAMVPTVIRSLLFLGAGCFLMTYPLENHPFFQLSEDRAIIFSRYRFIFGLGLVILTVLILLLKVIKLKMICYEVTADRIEFSRGILDRRIDNIDMYRVVDLRLRRSLLDCIFGIGTVGLITTDKTDPDFVFKKVRDCRCLYDIIKRASLDADRRNGVVHLE